MEVMDSSFFISVSNSTISDWKSLVVSLLRYFQRAFSRFLTHNELWLFNQLEKDSTVVVSPILYDLLKKAEDYRMKTEGRFSPYMLSHLEAHGYKQSFPFLVEENEKEAKMDGELESQPLIFHKDRAITKKTAQKVDLGGIAKGYAVEAIAKWLQTHAGSCCGIVDGGGDIKVWSNGEKTWRIGVMAPFQEDKEIGFFEIQNGGIATSNLVYRSWWQGATKKHHLLDGRTGMPVDSPIIQATVLTEYCLDAEIGAKLCFMDNLEQAKVQLKKLHDRFKFVLVKSNGEVEIGGNHT
ncbi:hypothetical protein AC623_16255 [Bacillus sp. FJAT-27231]|nr:hypothetical protein AC623_16255 [Bacillus sp. FJAT-27231]